MVVARRLSPEAQDQACKGMTLTQAAQIINAVVDSLDSYHNHRPRRLLYPRGASVKQDPLATLQGIAAMLMARERQALSSELVQE